MISFHLYYMDNLKSFYLTILSLLFLFGINTMSAQSLSREYSDNNVYMYINNAQQIYWTGGPKLPHHELVIKNTGSQTVNVRVLIKVVLRNGQGNYLNEKTQEKTVSLSPGSSKNETIWMSTANNNNAYYCVEGFRVLSVNTQSYTQTTNYDSKTYFKKETYFYGENNANRLGATYYPNGKCNLSGYILVDECWIRATSEGRYYINNGVIYVTWDEWINESYKLGNNQYSRDGVIYKLK